MVGRRIRLTVQLVSTKDGYQRWSDTYERTIDDVLALPEELARAVVTALPETVAAGAEKRGPTHQSGVGPSSRSLGSSRQTFGGQPGLS